MKELEKVKLCGTCSFLKNAEQKGTYPIYCENRLLSVTWNAYWKHSNDRMPLYDVRKCKQWDIFKFKLLKIKEKNERNSIK